MNGEDMPPPARGCLSAAKAGVFGIHRHIANVITVAEEYFLAGTSLRSI